MNIIDYTITNLDGAAFYTPSVHKCIFYIFIQLVVQLICLYHDHHKHMSNELSSPVRTDVISLGLRNFSAPL